MVAITPTDRAYFDPGRDRIMRAIADEFLGIHDSEPDPDAGRDIGEPDTDPRDFEDYLADYVRDAYAVLQTTPDHDPLTTAYRAGLHAAAVELLTRYHQETTDADHDF